MSLRSRAPPPRTVRTADPARSWSMLDYMANMARAGRRSGHQFEYDEMSEFAASSCKSGEEIFGEKQEGAAIRASLNGAENGRRPGGPGSSGGRGAGGAARHRGGDRAAITAEGVPTCARRGLSGELRACHGPAGTDGRLLQLDPKPTNFHDAERMSGISPFQAYNTITLGVEGTGMISLRAPSESDIWDLAFYVTSLRHGEISDAPGEPAISLADASSKSDAELEAALAGDKAAKAALIAAARTFAGGQANSLAKARSELHAAVAAVDAGDYSAARTHAISAYLDGVEPVEPQLNALDSDLVVRLETAMVGFRSVVDKKALRRRVPRRDDRGGKGGGRGGEAAGRGRCLARVRVRHVRRHPAARGL
ncbi:MAG: hypothetical protein R3F11_12950 [Verrucomicrobiales bacterium]